MVFVLFIAFPFFLSYSSFFSRCSFFLSPFFLYSLTYFSPPLSSITRIPSNYFPFFCIYFFPDAFFSYLSTFSFHPPSSFFCYFTFPLFNRLTFITFSFPFPPGSSLILHLFYSSSPCTPPSLYLSQTTF